LGLPEGGDGVGDFVLEDFDEFFAFRLTIGSALYKYMRIYLWTASSRCLPAAMASAMPYGRHPTESGIRLP